MGRGVPELPPPAAIASPAAQKPKAQGPAAFSTRLKLVAFRRVTPCHGFKSTSHPKQNSMGCHQEATKPGTRMSLMSLFVAVRGLGDGDLPGW